MLFLIILNSNAQPKKINNPANVVSEANFYIEGDELLSDAIVLKFKEKIVISDDVSQTYSQRIEKKYQTILNVMKEIEKKAGKITLDKSIKNDDPNNLLRINKRTGEYVTIKDLSQLYHLRFEKPVPVAEVIKKFKDLPEVEYVHQPVTIVFNYTPNDSLFASPGQWNLDVVQATFAWNITTGNTSISIGLVDCGVNFNHEDLQGQFNRTDGVISGTHGTLVAGIAGAHTNNSLGIASLGFNIRLNSFNFDSSSIADAIYMCARYSDIINMSFGTACLVTSKDLEELGCPYPDKWNLSMMPYDYPEIADAVANAIAQGVVCVASAGNVSMNLRSDGYPGPYPELCDCSRIPFVNYPAAYPGVIAVSGTRISQNEEQFEDDWNYGSFVDVSAPGKNILTTKYDGGYGYYDGTSLSAPLTAALCALLLSLNPSLTVQQVSDYITNSTDKIDFTRYPYNENGWNQYLGYGRINAYKAVQPPSAPQNLSYTIVSGHPRLLWSASDWDVKLYEIWRDLGSGYVKIAEVNAPTTTYDDNELLISSINPYSAWYYVKAKDLTNQTSSASSPLRIHYFGLQKESFKVVQLPSDPVLYKNFPNPFNPMTLIQFSIPEERHVSIKLYNSLGQEIETIIEGVKPAGFYQINFNASRLSSGIYLCTMTTGNTVMTQKMILQK